MKNLPLFLLLGILTLSCSDQDADAEYSPFQLERIERQVKIAEKLKVYMENKEFDNAITLFSSRQQATIRKYKEDKEMFDLWCFAWTFDEGKLERYIHLIKKNKAPFVFEQGEWKIDEQ